MRLIKAITSTVIALILLIAATATKATPIELALSEATYKQGKGVQTVKRKVVTGKGHTIVFFGDVRLEATFK